VFVVKPFDVMADTHINPGLVPVIVAVTFGADVNALENVTANAPELVVPDPYEYLVNPDGKDPPFIQEEPL